ncbi:MAG: YifB family Mg chelatase-like AAA ATPase [Spirochaetaceae bacterium]|jgi:magnesium chelatase family protein|nr:YifB family Mg chelatase-like AAA ATPase [Spirochaetaceae bacterium]
MQVMAYAPYGADGIIIRVEADIRRGIPGVDITGLAEGAVREARERVRAAFRNSGYTFPQDRILINLAPAGVRKDGASLDLPIALAVMAAAGSLPSREKRGAAGPELPPSPVPPVNVMILGELELSGRLRPVRGALAAAAAALRAGIRDFIVPADNAREAAILSEGRYAAVATLGEAVRAFSVLAETGAFPPNGPSSGPVPVPAPDATAVWGDFADVRGQGRYKRALEIAAAGGHNLLAFGPPGGGKTMLARRMPSIMASLEAWEAVEVTRLHSLAGQLEGGLITKPPFRSPHHSATPEGILGGGKTVRPGEISLASFGILFLDEAPEFRASVLQALREPLEDRVITISRAEGPVPLPADFQLILAANACPCGRLGVRLRERRRGAGPPDPSLSSSGCFCSPDEIHRYWRKFSGALLDRVELRTTVIPPSPQELAGKREEASEEAARRVNRAVAIQRERFKGTGIRRNARMTTGMTEKYCVLTREARGAFHTAMEKLNLSGRAFHGILRVGRTIADLEGAEFMAADHILEAVQHRRLGDDPYDVFI